MRGGRARCAGEAAVLLAPVLWVVSRYDETWFFYDEWSVIRHTVRAPAGDLLFNLNGHLWLFPALVYRAQVAVGLSGHWLVYGFFCLSLLASSLALRGLLVQLGVVSWVATIGAVSVVHAGFASQNTAFEVQLAGASAQACALAGVALLLRDGRRAQWLGLLLVLAAVGWDSATVLLVLLLAVPLVWFARGWRSCAFLAPAVLATGLWTLLADRGPSFPAGAEQTVRFGAWLLAHSAGGLAGGGPLVGAAVLALAAAVVVRRRGELDRRDVGVLVGGLLGTGATVGVLALTRVGVADGHLVDYNRYLGQVALFVVLLVLPLVAVSRRLERAAAAVLVVGLVLGVQTMRDYRRGFEAWNQQTRDGVATLVGQLAAGCAPPDTATPLGGVGPQVTVGLVRELRERGVSLPEAAVDC